MAVLKRPSVPGISRRLLVCLLALAIGAAVAVRPLQAQSASIDDVKAAFLFNFTKFVAWPADAFPSATSPLVIGVLGDDTISDSLREIIRGKTVDGRELRLKRVSMSDDLAQLHVMFIGRSETGRLPDIMTRLNGRAVLIVADAIGFCIAGGHIQFDADNSRVRFEINLDATQHSRLGVSSKLLSLAKIVHSAKPAGAR